MGTIRQRNHTRLSGNPQPKIAQHQGKEPNSPSAADSCVRPPRRGDRRRPRGVCSAAGRVTAAGVCVSPGALRLG